MPRSLLVPERGLGNTRRNRRWLALVGLLDAETRLAQDECENLAWKILRTMEDTR